jgi:hypothetical protein
MSRHALALGISCVVSIRLLSWIYKIHVSFPYLRAGLGSISLQSLFDILPHILPTFLLKWGHVWDKEDIWSPFTWRVQFFIILIQDFVNLENCFWPETLLTSFSLHLHYWCHWSWWPTIFFLDAFWGYCVSPKLNFLTKGDASKLLHMQSIITWSSWTSPHNL